MSQTGNTLTARALAERRRARRQRDCVSGAGRDICEDCLVDYRRCGWKAEPGERLRDFMVTDEIWATIGATTYGCLLCIPCVEKRLGRQLVADDYIDYPINIGLREISEARMKPMLALLES